MTKMTGDDIDDMPIAARYVLGRLSADERAVFEAELAHNPALRVELTDWQEQLAEQTGILDEDDAPLDLWDGIKQEAWNEVHQPWHRRIRLWEFALGGATAALVAFAASEIGWFDIAPTETIRAEITGAESDVRLVARLDPLAAVVWVDRAQGAARPDRALELWIISGGNTPVSLGILGPERISSLRVGPKDLERFADGALIAVSDEPAGGSPTGAPSGAILATGPVRVLSNP